MTKNREKILEYIAKKYDQTIMQGKSVSRDTNKNRKNSKQEQSKS